MGACTRHSYSKLYYLCLLSSLNKLVPPPTPPPNEHWPNINEFHEVKTGENQPLSTCQVSCTIDSIPYVRKLYYLWLYKS